MYILNLLDAPWSTHIRMLVTRILNYLFKLIKSDNSQLVGMKLLVWLPGMACSFPGPTSVLYHPLGAGLSEGAQDLEWAGRWFLTKSLFIICGVSADLCTASV